MNTPRDAHPPRFFSTRDGGVSAGPFESLNFGNPAELPPGVPRDPAANIEENFRRALAAMGCAGRRVVQVHQVHGSGVRVVHRDSPSAELDGPDPKADAIVTDDPGVVLAVRVADCCPVLLWAEDGRAVAAVHAGWRGVVAGVVQAACLALRQLAGPARLHASIGPCIGVESFEVGPEVVAAFDVLFADAAGPPVVAARMSSGKAHIDLKAALARQLAGAGVHAIATDPRCTVRDAEFFSHRRDRGVTGRMIGAIGPIAG